MIETTEISIRSATNADCEIVKALVFGVLQEYGLETAPNGTDNDLVVAQLRERRYNLSDG